ncbi:MAG TPA: hypothetical protein PK668_02720 [Myxococcota bacterium]|nr:hypothetical protein [Myxococcota bacterium]HRY94516.1 hypothetical protein [Myxococcota bacterium]HSA20015.1 hypothetical protein [Myxococcota bacterium]
MRGRLLSLILGWSPWLGALALLVPAGGCEAGTVAEDACVGLACSGHGLCQAVDGEPVCRCDPGYQPEGLECAPTPAGPCDGVDCAGHGACRVVAEAAACDCEPGYHAEGLACLVDPADPCEGQTCSGLGACQVQQGAAVCVCPGGTHPVGLSCVPDDPCAGVGCGVNAHCDAGACVCDPDTTGDPLAGCQPPSSEEERVRARLVEIALAEVGMCEGVDERPYMLGQPGLWCYDFVDWVYAESGEGLTQPYYLPQRRVGELPAGWRPRPGDLVKYTFQHYAMVKELSPDGSTVYTIEGNFNSCVTEWSTTDAQVEYYGTLEEHFP